MSAEKSVDKVLETLADAIEEGEEFHGFVMVASVGEHYLIGGWPTTDELRGFLDAGHGLVDQIDGIEPAEGVDIEPPSVVH